MSKFRTKSINKTVHQVMAPKGYIFDPRIPEDITTAIGVDDFELKLNYRLIEWEVNGQDELDLESIEPLLETTLIKAPE